MSHNVHGYQVLVFSSCSYRLCRMEAQLESWFWMSFLVFTLQSSLPRAINGTRDRTCWSNPPKEPRRSKFLIIFWWQLWPDRACDAVQMESAEGQWWGIATKSKGFLYRWFEEIAKKCWQRLLPLTSSHDFGAPKGRLLLSLQLGSKPSFLCHKEDFFFNKNTRLENYCSLTKMSC